MLEKQVCILDYGSGNVRSVLNVLEHLGASGIISNQRDDIINCSHIILPGVGAFGPAMEKIKQRIPLGTLEREVIEKAKPFLGICVGMQILGSKGFEFGEHQGLGWIPGDVTMLDVGQLRLPHIGWNNIEIRKHTSELVHGLSELKDFYFANSFGLNPLDKDHIVATTWHGKNFNSIVQKGRIFGVQFHPEKSQKAGHQLLKNFLAIV